MAPAIVKKPVLLVFNCVNNYHTRMLPAGPGMQYPGINTTNYYVQIDL